MTPPGRPRPLLLSHLVSPPSQAGEAVLLSHRLQHRIHGLGPPSVRVQRSAERHSAISRRVEHLGVPRDQPGDLRRNPADVRSVHLEAEAAGAARA